MIGNYSPARRLWLIRAWQQAANWHVIVDCLASAGTMPTCLTYLLLTWAVLYLPCRMLPVRRSSVGLELPLVAERLLSA